MKLASSAGFPVVARGAGTGLSGGAISPEGGVVIAFARMNRILEVDADNMRAVVQPGVVNQSLSDNVAHLGLYFAPDPSSQKACTIGGNVAENSGGPHTLAQRGHGESRDRNDRGAAERESGALRRESSVSALATTSRDFSSARKARSASSPKSR